VRGPLATILFLVILNYQPYFKNGKLNKGKHVVVVLNARPQVDDTIRLA